MKRIERELKQLPLRGPGPELDCNIQALLAAHPDGTGRGVGRGVFAGAMLATAVGCLMLGIAIGGALSKNDPTSPITAPMAVPAVSAPSAGAYRVEVVLQTAQRANPFDFTQSPAAFPCFIKTHESNGETNP